MNLLFKYFFLLLFLVLSFIGWRVAKLSHNKEHSEKLSWQFCEKNNECIIYPAGACDSIISINKDYLDAYKYHMDDMFIKCGMGGFYHSHKYSIPDLTEEESNPPDLSKFKPACLEGKCAIIRK